MLLRTPEFLNTPQTVKLSNGSVYIQKSGIGRGASTDIYFDNDGKGYISSCSYLFDLPNQLCNAENAKIPFRGEEVLFLVSGKEEGPSGRVLGVILSGKFYDGNGRTIVLKTPDDKARDAIGGARRVYFYIKLIMIVSVVLCCISIFIVFLYRKGR